MLIDQNVEYHLKSNEYFESELKIKRTYRAGWPHTTNRNYTRVLVPLGSFLTGAKLDGKDIISQIDVSEEYGKTVFGFWFNVDESQSKIVELNYRLPFSKEALSKYSLNIQKQPGTIADNYFVQYNDEVLFSGILDSWNKKIAK